MFDPVDPRQSFPALEEGILRYWREENTFRRSIDQRANGSTFSFYDGPPFATGLPHYGHLLAGTIKDVIPRYRAMRGDRVERRFGWDCHGLPIENLIEKEQGITNKRQIEELGVAQFNALCRGSVQRYTKEWRTTVERSGRWVDMDNDYRTMDATYMESIWWVFKSVHDKGLIYEGYKPMHICPRCVTPLSNFEVTTGYKDVQDQSATVMFRMKGKKEKKGTKGKELHDNTYFLAWTTTPWTLPGNLFLAVHPDVNYLLIEVKETQNRYWVAQELADKVFKDIWIKNPKDSSEQTINEKYSIAESVAKGSDLAGTEYEPLFPYFAQQYADTAFRVVTGDFVTTTDGTGIVHIAPGFGEDDYAVGLKEGTAMLQHVSMEGRFTDDVTDFAGMEVKPKDDPSSADKAIIKYLKKHDLLFSEQSYVHSYPHCWRCDSPLLNYATSSWFVAVEKVKDRMQEHAAKTAWVPSHIRDGRFGKWLAGARDWAISRNRYWGTPLPIWRDPQTGALDVLGSRDDLAARDRTRFTKVTAVRHGESEGNLIPIYQSQVPGTNLTKKGQAQAAAAGEHLREANVDVIYSSPLARAKQTAEAIAAATGATVIVDERLREVSFGDYEGKTVDFSDLKLVRDKRAKKIESNSPETIYHFPGMETWESCQARIDDFLEDILPRHRGQHVVMVSHADLISRVRQHFTQEDPVKLSHLPFPPYATPHSYFWDHARGAQLDLHKEVVDGLRWPSLEADPVLQATFVRHGQTEWNKSRTVQGGNADVSLSAEGRAQAEELAATLSPGDFDVMISSDLVRAVETAEILGKAVELPIAAQWELLRERHAGDWSGRKEEDVLQELPPLPENGDISMHYATPGGGESLDAFLDRARAVCDRLREEYPGKRVLVVCHGGMLRALRAVRENLPYAEAAALHFKNCARLDMDITPDVRRIPDVLDCWFESGSMPYAQAHFPFAFAADSGERLAVSNDEAGSAIRYPLAANRPPVGFPADFIAEGVDQTRLWFYTLMVLSTVLFDDTAYKNVVVNGIVLAEDGKKMSKKLKNYPDPTLVLDTYGADAMRFALMSSPAVRGEDLRFSEKTVAEAVRGVLLPLWNAYSFFVTYANDAGFTPVAVPHASGHPLDRAIRAEAQDLVNRMTAQLDAYDLSSACAEIHDTIDALTNWYIRLSRRRFAGKGAHDAAEADTADHEADRQDALTTLYGVLIQTCQVLAPFCPFVTDAIYLNLVPEKHGSIHLTDWPQPRALSKEEETSLRATRLLRSIVSLGLKLRAEKKVKVRQPLASATAAVPAKLMAGLKLSDDDLALLRQELNVKDIRLVDDPGTLGTAVAMVDAKKVGPRLGGKVQELIAAGKRGEFSVREDGGVRIGDELLGPEEVSIVYRGAEGSDVAGSGGIVVSLDTRITDELRLEGLAREIIRGVQTLRKDAGLSIADRIALSVRGADAAMEAHGERIAQETGAMLQENGGEEAEIETDEGVVAVRFQKL